MSIIDLIPIGHDNAVTKKQLMIQTGLDERTIRKEIEEARQSGHIITNLQDGAGYFVPAPEEIALAEAQYKQERARALNILKSNMAINSWIADVKAGRIQ